MLFKSFLEKDSNNENREEIRMGVRAWHRMDVTSSIVFHYPVDNSKTQREQWMLRRSLNIHCAPHNTCPSQRSQTGSHEGEGVSGARKEVTERSSSHHQHKADRHRAEWRRGQERLDLLTDSVTRRLTAVTTCHKSDFLPCFKEWANCWFLKCCFSVGIAQ